jgi:hypothetical protein
MNSWFNSKNEIVGQLKKTAILYRESHNQKESGGKDCLPYGSYDDSLETLKLYVILILVLDSSYAYAAYQS